MFSLPLGGCSINAVCGGGIISVRGETKWSISGHAHIVEAAHLTHCAHKFFYAGLTKEVGLALTVHHLVNTYAGGILLTSLTLHVNACSCSIKCAALLCRLAVYIRDC